MQPTRKIRITPRAREDLRNIGRYTERAWGKAQRNRYLKSIEARFQWLAENPLLGKRRTDIGEGYHSFPEGEHVVFYLFDSGNLDIIGITHKEMDTISHFVDSDELR